MICTRIAWASMVTLAVGGLALLFVSDLVVPPFLPAFPAEGVWLGELLGASWLAVAALTWGSRAALLGGIYGRPVVSANASLFVISALSLLRPATGGAAPMPLIILAAIFTAFALLYGWLLMRGPFPGDFERARAAATGAPPENPVGTTRD